MRKRGPKLKIAPSNRVSYLNYFVWLLNLPLDQPKMKLLKVFLLFLANRNALFPDNLILYRPRVVVCLNNYLGYETSLYLVMNTELTEKTLNLTTSKTENRKGRT